MSAPVSIGPFLGLNNLLPPTQMAQYANGKKVGDYLSQADDVDVTDANTLRRRSGWQKKLDGKNVRSLFALDDGTALVADYDKLYRLTLQGDTLLRDAVLSGLSTHAAVSYAQGAGEVFLSDGVGLWSYKGGRMAAVGIPTPSRLPTLSCQAGGSLAQGLYQVAITHIRSDGQESGTGGTVQAVAPVNGVLMIDHLPSSAPAGVTHTGVYVSSANGDMLFLQDVVPVGTSSLRLPLLADGARRCLTHRLMPMPAGEIVRWHNAKLLVAKGPMLYSSLPHSTGLFDPVSGYIPLPAPITLLEPVPGGVYVAADKTYFASEDMTTLREVLPFGAVPGSAVRNLNDMGLCWFSPRGLVKADADGGAALSSDDRIAVRDAQVAAAMVREQDGLRQLVMSLRPHGGANVAAVRSHMDAEIVKKGTTL